MTNAAGLTFTSTDKLTLTHQKLSSGPSTNSFCVHCNFLKTHICDRKEPKTQFCSQHDKEREKAKG